MCIIPVVVPTGTTKHFERAYRIISLLLITFSYFFNQPPNVSPIRASDKTDAPVEVKLLTNTSKVMSKLFHGKAM